VSLTDVDPAFAGRISRDNVRCIALNKGPGHGLRLYPTIFRLLRELRPAIVHTRNLAALEAVVPAWIAGVAARVHGEHGRDVGDLDGSSLRHQRVRRLFRAFVTRYVAVSPDLERYLHERIGVPESRIDQIYNGVDTGRFCPAPDGRAPIAGCPFQGPAYWLVGAVGRLEAVKDHANLARAFVVAVNADPEARRRMRLVIVGNGTLKGEVEAILASAGARDLAWFAGERADVVPVLQGLDCFVLPSLAEGVSNTILEAMACGLPVVATRVGANTELVDEDVTGRTVPAADNEALARAIGAYFTAPGLSRDHGQAARRRVERKFNLDRMVENYHRLYSDLLAGRARPIEASDRALRHRGNR
jgi:sugar transferase (PEP-CTERM/EpsH1 system associated)